MVDLSTAFGQLFIILILAVIGFIAAKAHIIRPEGIDTLGKILLNIAVPGMVIGSVGAINAQEAAEQVPLTFLLAAVQYFLLLGVSFLCNLIFRTPKKDRMLYLFMGTAPNNGFVGLPLIAAVYGEQTIILSSIFILVFNLFVTSLGFWILSRGGDKEMQDAYRFSFKRLINAPLIASIVALALFFAGIHLPPVIQGTLEIAGSLCVPLAMMLIGVFVAGSNVRAVLGEWRLYPINLIRQLLAPLGLLFLLWYVNVSPLVIEVFVMMFAMPTGTMVPTFAAMYDQDVDLAARGTVLSTLCSFVTIPVLMTVMAFYF